MIFDITIEAKDAVMILAVLSGPILAVQVQKIIENFKQKEARRLNIFKTLMSTRAERVLRDHVQALNMIDIEFYGRKIFGYRFQTKKEKSVTNAWKNYNDSLNEKIEEGAHPSAYKDRDNKFVEMMYYMSQSLGYDFDEVQLRRDCYRPQIFADVEGAQLSVLNGAARVFNGGTAIPITIVSSPKQQIEEQPEMPEQA